MLACSCSPQNTLVEIVYDQRGQPSFAIASPMIRSDSPPAYDSALSKKLTPASYAAFMHSDASPTPNWSPNVTHEPSDSTLTWRPARPSRRYSMFMRLRPPALDHPCDARSPSGPPVCAWPHS